MKVALIFGITGQDGSYLAELLLEKNYTVVGVMRRSSSFNTGRIDSIRDKIKLVYGDICDTINVFETINKCPSAPQYQYGKTSISSIDSFKKQFIDTYSSDRNKLESATNFIGNIFENRKDSIEAIKNNPNKTEFHSALVKILESKQVCS
jgi:GDP-D-mannose dehydratase